LTGEPSPQSVGLSFGNSIHDIVAIVKCYDQLRNLLRRVLEVIIHRNDNVIASSADTEKQRVVLAKVAHQAKPEDLRTALCEVLHDRPASINASVVNQDHLVLVPKGGQHMQDTVDELREAFLTVEYGHNYRDSR
jgi:hypothetical protein